MVHGKALEAEKEKEKEKKDQSCRRCGGRRPIGAR